VSVKFVGKVYARGVSGDLEGVYADPSDTHDRAANNADKASASVAARRKPKNRKS
jgi:hypothetical protein